MNDNLEVMQLFLCYGLCLKEGVQLIVLLLDLVKLLLLLHRVHYGRNFFIQHLDLCAHLVQDLVSSSYDAHLVIDFPENSFCIPLCSCAVLLEHCYLAVKSSAYALAASEAVGLPLVGSVVIVLQLLSLSGKLCPFSL
jgi:hypothetical protein